MPLLIRPPLPLLERARQASDDAEILRDHALSLAYRAAVLREEAAALRAQARQTVRHVRARRPPVA
jgi:hypothetical protein